MPSLFNPQNMAPNDRPRRMAQGRPNSQNRPVDAPLPPNLQQHPSASHAPANKPPRDDRPAWMIQQEQQQQNLSQQEESQRFKMRYQASPLPQASANTNQQQQQNLYLQEQIQRLKIRYQASLLPQASASTNQQFPSVQQQHISDSNHLHPSMQHKNGWQPDGDFTQGQSILTDMFSQGGYNVVMDPAHLLQYANQQNVQARGVLQSMQNAGSAQTYIDQQMFGIGYQNQQNTGNGQAYFQQPDNGNQNQQVHRNVTRPQQSPDQGNHVRTASQNRFQHQNAVDPTLDPRLFVIPAAVQSASPAMSNQTQPTQYQSPNRSINSSNGQRVSSHHMYNTIPSGPVDFRTAQHQEHEIRLNDAFRQAQNIVPMDNTSDWNQNIVSSSSMAVGSSTARPDLAQFQGMGEGDSTQWQVSSNSSNLTASDENPRQVPQTSVSPTEMVTAKPNLIQIPQFLPSHKAAVLESSLDRMPSSTPDRRKRRASQLSKGSASVTKDKKQKTDVTEQEVSPMPVLPPGGPKRHASQMSVDPEPASATQDKRQKTAPNQTQKIPRPPMKLHGHVTKDVMEFQLEGQRSGGAFRRTFVAAVPEVTKETATEVTKVSMPNNVGHQNPVSADLSAQQPKPVTTPTSQKVDAPTVVPLVKITGLTAATNPQQSYSLPSQNFSNGYTAAGNTSYDQHRPRPILQPKPPPPYHSPYAQPISLPWNASRPSSYPYSFIPSPNMSPRGVTNYPSPLPVRPTSPQPPPEYVPPEYITKTWHPQPCGCCPNGIPGRLIQEGNAFRNFDKINMEVREAREAREAAYRKVIEAQRPIVEARLMSYMQ